jgi:hypothetical protein
MVGDNKKKAKGNSVELEDSLAPAEAEVGAVAKADQNSGLHKLLHLLMQETCQKC